MWIEQVWLKYIEKLNGPTILIADSFSTHSSENARQKLEEKNSFLSIIPSGCSSNIQPLHRGVKRFFKDFVESSYAKHISNTKLGAMSQEVSLSNGNHITSSSARTQLPTMKQASQLPLEFRNIANWVHQAYQALRDNKVIVSFLIISGFHLYWTTSMNINLCIKIPF